MERNENKIVIFDWGGVVESHNQEEYNVHKAIVRTIRHFNNKLQEDNSILEKYRQLWNDENGINVGTLSDIASTKKWIERIKKAFDFECTSEEYVEVYNEEFGKIEYYKDVVEFIHSLKKYCKIGILSNLEMLAKNRIDKQLDLKQFDYVWLSFEVGLIKPDRRIYEYVQSECKIKPNSILFIDDCKENTDAANDMGWNVCNCTGKELDKIKKVVQEFFE